MISSLLAKLSVRNKLLLGFGLLLLLMVGVSLNTYLSVQSTAVIQDRVTNLRTPTVQAGMLLEDGINQSLAGLRGYMILGKDPKKAETFKAERAGGWAKIDQSMARFREFAKNWTVPANVERLNNMEALVNEFRQAQAEVEGVAHADENIASFKLLLTDAAPRAGKILKHISAIIDEEDGLEATPERKKLLKLLADSRGSFAVGLANIRAYLLSGDTQFRDNFQGRWTVNSERFEQIEGMSQLFTDTQQAAWAQYRAIRSEFSPLPAQMFALRAAPDWNKANHWLGSKAAPKARAIKQILQEMRESQDKLLKNDVARLQAETRSLIMVMVIGTLIAIVIGVLVALYVSHVITSPLKAVVAKAKAIAEGDLSSATLQVEGTDELAALGRAVNEMNVNLHSVVQLVSHSTEQLATAAEELSAVADDSGKNILQQSTEIDQVATAMNQMAATVQEVANNATQAAVATRNADGESKGGRQIVAHTAQAIRELAHNVEESAEVINQLERDSEDIGAILDVIKSIAEQTNLLALNAAIEAARAGEQGRGFAVVADEVRTLASRTQDSTNEIQSMIEKLQSGSRNAVASMVAGREKAQYGVDQAGEAAHSLEAIDRAVNTINEMNIMIASAAEEQTAVANEMNESIVRISMLGQNTTAGASQTATSSQEMARLAADLQVLVRKFTL